MYAIVAKFAGKVTGLYLGPVGIMCFALFILLAWKECDYTQSQLSPALQIILIAFIVSDMELSVPLSLSCSAVIMQLRLRQATFSIQKGSYIVA